MVKQFTLKLCSYHAQLTDYTTVHRKNQFIIRYKLKVSTHNVKSVNLSCNLSIKALSNYVKINDLY
jgi:hypothetical protein